MIVRNLSRHRTSSHRLAFAEGTIRSKEPRVRRGNSCTFVCMSSPPWFFFSSWWCVDTKDNKEETSGHRSSLIKVPCEALTDCHVKSLTFTIAYVDPETARTRVGENHPQLFPWHWPGDDESILLTVTSIVDTTILSIVNGAFAGLPDPNRNIQELWGCWEDLNEDGCPYALSITSIFDINTAAKWVQAAMKLSNPTLFGLFLVANKPTAQLVPIHLCVVAAATFLWLTLSRLQPRIWSRISGRHWRMMVRCCALIQEVSWQRYQDSKSLNGSFKGGSSNSSDTLKSSKTVLLVSLPITSIVLLLMMMRLAYASTIGLWIVPLQALWPIGSIQAAAKLQISCCEDGIHWLDGCSRICVVGGYVSGTLEGGRMGDNFEFCLFYYYSIHIHGWRAVLKVCDVGIDRWDICFWERHSGSYRNGCMAIM